MIASPSVQADYKGAYSIGHLSKNAAVKI